LGEPKPTPTSAYKGPGKEADYGILTSLFLEMEACETRGCWHRDFMRQTKQERLKWLLYTRMKREREAHFNKKEADEMKKRQKEAQIKMPTTRRPR